MNDKFLKKDESGNYFDLKGAVIKNSEPYYDGLHDDNDLVPKKYVDTENSKQDIAIADKTSKAYVDTQNGKQNILIAEKTSKVYVDNSNKALQTNVDGTKEALREVSVKLDQGLDKKLSIHGGNSMTVDLDMGNNKIISLKPPTTKDNAVNKQYVDTAVLNKVDKNDTLLLDGSKTKCLQILT